MYFGTCKLLQVNFLAYKLGKKWRLGITMSKRFCLNGNILCGLFVFDDSIIPQSGEKSVVYFLKKPLFMRCF